MNTVTHLFYCNFEAVIGGVQLRELRILRRLLFLGLHSDAYLLTALRQKTTRLVTKFFASYFESFWQNDSSFQGIVFLWPRFIPLQSSLHSSLREATRRSNVCTCANNEKIKSVLEGYLTKRFLASGKSCLTTTSTQSQTRRSR